MEWLGGVMSSVIHATCAQPILSFFDSLLCLNPDKIGMRMWERENMPVISSEIGIDRRSFLKLSVSGLVTAMVPSMFKDLHLTTPEENLANLGLGDYIGVYHSSRRFLESFGFHPNTFFNIADTLEKGANGEIININNPEVQKLASGWGEHAGEAVNKAREKAGTFDIYLSPGYDPNSGSGEEMRNFLWEMAGYFPQYILVLPKRINIVQAGGEASDDFTNLDSPSNLIGPQDRVTALNTFLHEAEHQMERRWEEIKPFMDKNKFINYITAYFDNLYGMAIEFLNSPSPDYFQKLKNYSWFKGKDTSNPGLNKPLVDEIRILDDTFSTNNNLSPIANIDINCPEMAWVELMHKALKKVVEIPKEGGKFEFINRNHDQIYPLMIYGLRMLNANLKGFGFEGLFDGIGHYLVNPFDWNNFFPDIILLDEWNKPETKYQLAMQKARLNAFSTLSFNSVDPNYPEVSILNNLAYSQPFSTGIQTPLDEFSTPTSVSKMETEVGQGNGCGLGLIPAAGTLFAAGIAVAVAKTVRD